MVQNEFHAALTASTYHFITADAYAAAVEALASSAFTEQLVRTKAETMLAADSFWPTADQKFMQTVRPYKVENGILHLPVAGTLLSDFPYYFSGWATGYEYLRKAAERAGSDPLVKGIMLLVDSGGGKVAELFETVDFLAEVGKKKQINAFVKTGAFSAAYAITSVAKKITMARSSEVGSIGVITSHVDHSERLKALGLNVTLIFAGEGKTDGHPSIPLSDRAKERIQASVDHAYGDFVALVAKNRGMEEQAVRDAQALTYLPKDAIKLGLADKEGTVAEAFAVFETDIGVASNQLFEDEETEMSTETKKPDVDAEAIASNAKTAGVAEGVTAAKARLAAIMALPEAQGANREFAMEMALTTDLTAEQVKPLLAKLPKAAAPKKEMDFDKRMQNGNPEIGAEGDGESKASRAEQMKASYSKASGHKFKKVA